MTIKLLLLVVASSVLLAGNILLFGRLMWRRRVDHLGYCVAQIRLNSLMDQAQDSTPIARAEHVSALANLVYYSGLGRDQVGTKLAEHARYLLALFDPSRRPSGPVASAVENPWAELEYAHPRAIHSLCQAVIALANLTKANPKVPPKRAAANEIIAFLAERREAKQAQVQQRRDMSGRVCQDVFTGDVVSLEQIVELLCAVVFLLEWRVDAEKTDQ